jgi:hypothetical protein
VRLRFGCCGLLERASQCWVEEEKIGVLGKMIVFSFSNRHKHSKRQSKALASLKELGYWLVKKV